MQPGSSKRWPRQQAEPCAPDALAGLPSGLAPARLAGDMRRGAEDDEAFLAWLPRVCLCCAMPRACPGMQHRGLRRKPADPELSDHGSRALPARPALPGDPPRGWQAFAAVRALAGSDGGNPGNGAGRPQRLPSRAMRRPDNRGSGPQAPEPPARPGRHRTARRATSRSSSALKSPPIVPPDWQNNHTFGSMMRRNRLGFSHYIDLPPCFDKDAARRGKIPLRTLASIRTTRCSFDLPRFY